ncbi:MAG: PhnD/SsuA/transferrin family substrate-binding protein [Myxococcaceae bacterium]|nr:PhnD/SsuA/transferrin family substrate-binding protein [Myxococcaceae bacterium]
MTNPAFGEVKEHVRAELLAVALTRRLRVPVTILSAASQEELIEALTGNTVEAAWVTAELCDRFEKDARVVLRAVRSGSTVYHAAFVCRADDPVSLDALDGLKAAWVTRASTAGYLLPRAHLKENGIDPQKVFASEREYGSYRRALTAVLDGEADVTSVYCTHPDDRAVRAVLAEHVGRRENELVPFAFTRSTPSDGVLVTHRMPEDLSDAFVDALVSLGSTGSGLLPHLGLFDTEGFAVDGHVTPPLPSTSPRTHEPLLMLEVTADGTCLRAWSPSGKINGRPVAQLSGRPLAEVLGPDAASPVCALASESFRNRMGGRIDYHAGPEDDARWYSAEITLGALGTAALIIRDVTDSRALEEELYRLASYPLLTPDPVLEIDSDGGLIYANRAAHDRFPGLVAQGADHPISSALLAVQRSPKAGRNSALREVEVDGRVWKITVLSPPDADYIRAQVTDVTEHTPRSNRIRSTDFLRRPS